VFDVGLSIKAWLDINDNNYEMVKEVLEGYVKWVSIVQHKDDPNNIDVRIEPKFEIPSGDPYTGGWCRPQTDGPALRAMALSEWGLILQKAGHIDVAKNDVWPLVKFDLEWVTPNWDSEGCDLWEEIRSRNFFFNRMAYIYSLNTAADFADSIGDNSMLAKEYRDKANEILEATKDHWNGEFIVSMDGDRPQDGSVIHAITTFGKYLYGPSSNEAAATILTVSKTFCREYKINQDENTLGKPGVLIGRYPGDHYAGGNPWQLLTAVLAECFYLGAQTTFKSIDINGGLDYNVDFEKNDEWIKLLDPHKGILIKYHLFYFIEMCFNIANISMFGHY
jgi:glucoamylase